MEWKESFFKEEMRAGFLVTEKRKKVWAVELEILGLFDEICKKYGLTYFAYYGTLLGAVRHQGFIPWDDDIDVVMFRDEYEKFKVIAAQEIREPYFFQNTYTDAMIWGFSKIRDSRTTAVEFPDMEETFHQGIFIDIFPFDSVDDGIHKEFSAVTEFQKLLWTAITAPHVLREALEAGGLSGEWKDFLLDYIEKDVRQRFEIFESFNASQFDATQKVNFITSELYHIGSKSVCKDWMKDIIYLPFENIQIPAPAEYDKILKQCYGDYRQPVQGGSDHEGIIFDPEVPYKEFLSGNFARLSEEGDPIYFLDR